MKLISARCEPRARPDQDREPGAGDLRTSLEIDDAERRTEIPVRLRVEAERRRRSVSTHFDVVGAALPDGHAFVRQVGNRQQTAIPPLLDGVQLDVELLDLLRPLAIGLLDPAGVQPLAFRARDFVAGSVLFPLEPFELRQYPAAARLQCGELFELARQIDSTLLQSRTQALEIVAQYRRIQHVADSTCDRISGMERSVRKAVFPAAGLGTRFLPATKVLPKEMLVLVDRPIIQYGVEEALQSGIENVILVTSRGKDIIEDHFDVAYELESVLERRGKTDQLDEVRRSLQMDQRRVGAAGRTARTGTRRPRHATIWSATSRSRSCLTDDVIDAHATGAAPDD